MICPRCQIATLCPGYQLFNPACLYCGARLIQTLGHLQIPREQIVQRRRAALASWVDYGHSEAQIRALAKGKLAIEPTGPAEAAVSAVQTHSKPRSRTPR